MCLSAAPTSDSDTSSFNAARRSSITEYKQTTADVSQVCDGRNLDQLRCDAGTEPTQASRSRRLPGSPGRNVSLGETPGPASLTCPPISEVAVDKEKHNQYFGKDRGAKQCGYESDAENIDQLFNHSAARKGNTNDQDPQEHIRSTSLDSLTSNSSQASCTCNTSTSKVAEQVTIRKLSEPMHRCRTTNSSISGIMKPCRYSSNNLCAMNASHMERRFNDSVDGGTQPMRRRSSCTDLHSASRSSEWVAHGVNFSKSMEVYVFKT